MQESIPTRAKFMSETQPRSIVARAVHLKRRLADALNRGETSVDSEPWEGEEVVEAIRKDFAAAGWTLVHHGVSISCR